jgi:hypothetical protein
MRIYPLFELNNWEGLFIDDEVEIEVGFALVMDDSLLPMRNNRRPMS